MLSSGELTCPPAEFVKPRLVLCEKNGHDIYPWLESCSCGGWLALSSWVGPTLSLAILVVFLLLLLVCSPLSIVLWSCLQKVSYSLSDGHGSVGGIRFFIFYSGRIYTSTLRCCLWKKTLKVSVQSCF